MGIADGWPTKIHYICDACRPCYSIILSVLNSVFAEFDTFVMQLTRVPRSPDLEIFVSMTTTLIMTMTTELITLPLAHVWDN